MCKWANFTKLILAVFILSLFPSQVIGSTTSTIASINKISIATDSYAILHIDSVFEDLPACAENTSSLVSFDYTSSQGSAFLTLALSAFHADSSVELVASTSTCGVWDTRALLLRLNIIK